MSTEKPDGQTGSVSPVVSNEIVSLLSREADTEAYDYGWDAGMRGATVVNSHFSLFQTGRTKHWQQGYDDALFATETVANEKLTQDDPPQ